MKIFFFLVLNSYWDTYDDWKKVVNIEVFFLILQWWSFFGQSLSFKWFKNINNLPSQES